MKNFLNLKRIFISIIALLVLFIAGCSLLFAESQEYTDDSIEENNPITESCPDIVEPTFTSAPTNEPTQKPEIIYPPFPDGIIEEFDVVFVDEYKLQFVTINGTLIGWFSKPVRTLKMWLVLDSFEVPLTEEEDSIFVYDGCYKNGEYDKEIVAIGSLDDEAIKLRFLSSEKIHFAWKLNRDTNEIEINNTENIECSAESSFRLEP